MPSALMKTDIAAASITTVRGSNADSWLFTFRTVDDAVDFGTIADNADSFADDSTSDSKALKIVIAEGSETIAIQDMDSLVIDGLTVWLPALITDDVLYVDTDGNTWYDDALTSPAGGVDVFNEAIGVAEADFDGTDFFAEALTITDTLTFEDTDYFSEKITVTDYITESVEEFTLYLNERIRVSDNISEQDTQTPDGSYGDFTEDSQINTDWTEI